jgi:hypothetical protein
VFAEEADHGVAPLACELDLVVIGMPWLIRPCTVTGGPATMLPTAFWLLPRKARATCLPLTPGRIRPQIDRERTARLGRCRLDEDLRQRPLLVA